MDVSIAGDKSQSIEILMGNIVLQKIKFLVLDLDDLLIKNYSTKKNNTLQINKEHIELGGHVTQFFVTASTHFELAFWSSRDTNVNVDKISTRLLEIAKVEARPLFYWGSEHCDK